VYKFRARLKAIMLLAPQDDFDLNSGLPWTTLGAKPQTSLWAFVPRRPRSPSAHTFARKFAPLPANEHNHITPFLQEFHWLKAAERSSLSLSASVVREQHRRTLLMNSVSRRISRHDVDYVPPRRRR